MRSIITFIAQMVQFPGLYVLTFFVFHDRGHESGGVIAEPAFDAFRVFVPAVDVRVETGLNFRLKGAILTLERPRSRFNGFLRIMHEIRVFLQQLCG